MLFEGKTDLYYSKGLFFYSYYFYSYYHSYYPALSENQ